VPVNKKFENV